MLIGESPACPRSLVPPRLPRLPRIHLRPTEDEKTPSAAYYSEACYCIVVPGIIIRESRLRTWTQSLSLLSLLSLLYLRFAGQSSTPSRCCASIPINWQWAIPCRYVSSTMSHNLLGALAINSMKHTFDLIGFHWIQLNQKLFPEDISHHDVR